MEKNVGIINYVESDVIKEKYKIITLDGKIDHLQILEIPKFKTEYQRWHIHTHKSIFEKALYVLAKQKPEDFKEMYHDLSKNDDEFFEIARNILEKIKREYDFE